ncbi:MAG: ComF family protein [Eubacterium sp.]|nr:ComF family protein [Eubacterium sp.]
MIKEALYKLSYSLFPRRCNLCGEVVALDEELCEECAIIKMIEGELCSLCGNPKKECACKKKERKPEYKRFIAPYYYKDSIAAAANRFKDYGYPELAPEMSKRMAQYISERFSEIDFDCITFVPLTKKKLEKRGYNQSELLANGVSEKLKIPVEELLIKIKNTPQQKRSSAQQRKVNLRGAFDLAEGKSADGKTILLIDDIKTTGSTINECSFVLNAYGANAVYAATFCMTKPKSKKEEAK